MKLFFHRLADGFMRQSIAVKSVILLLIAATIWFGYTKISSQKTPTSTFQTQAAQKGTLIVSVSASGSVSAANSAEVSTQTSGVVNAIFVTNGQNVKAGDAIAEMDLDLDGKQRAAQAYASFQSAKNSLESARANYYSLRSTLFSDWQTYMDKAENSTYTNPDGSPNVNQRNLPQFTTTQNDWLAAEAKFKNQEGVIAQAQTALNSAWASYQKSSPTIYAPISGVVSGLSLQVGAVLTSQTSSTGNSTSQRIANIITKASPQISVDLAQIDAPKVKIGNKATITLDAFPDKTFTGTVISVDTVGTVSSGVTSYPAVIRLDTGSEDIYSNMSATAKIITMVKDDVIMVPNSAIQTQNGETTVRILKNNTPQAVPVETGASNDTYTEIKTGISENDEVVTGSTGTTGTRTSTSTTSSPFSAFGNRSFGGGGMRINR